MKGRVRLIFCAITVLLGPSALGAEIRLGMRLSDALELLRQDGITLIYSSNLIKPGMRIEYLPDKSDPVELLRAILKTWQLVVQEAADGSLLIVRATPPIQNTAEAPPARAPPPASQLPEELVVSASRYQFLRGTGPSFAGFDAAALELEPEVGDDPLRVLTRLPGATRSDFSARTNARGGGSDENLILLDGMRLYDPFHLKGFQGLFSSVDSRLVESMDVYMGGYPAQYGDRMSSVVNITTVQPKEPFYGELTASFFNLSTLLAGNSDDGDTGWLVSARRGNLDRVVDVFSPKLGDPRYFEVHTRASHVVSEKLHLTGNVMVSKDNIRIADSDQEEFANGNYRDEYYWLRGDFRPHDGLEGYALASQTRLSNFRSGTVDKEGAASGNLTEDNSFRIHGLKTEWLWTVGTQSRLALGAEYRRETGTYHYQDDATFALLFLTAGGPTNTMRSTSRTASFSGSYMSGWASLQSPLTKNITAEAGLRWHRESLSEKNDSTVDPRLSLRYDFSENTTVRISAGRYSQSQTINELDFADGIQSFAAMQSADQYILSIEHEFDNGIAIRSEAYEKRYRNLRPRPESFLDPYTLLPQLWPDRVLVDAEKARAKGFELSVSRLNGHAWNWWLTYSLASVKDIYGDRREKRLWDQRHDIGAGLAWQHADWELSIAGTWRSGWRSTDTSLNTSMPVPLIDTGVRHGLQLGTYKRIDARVARVFSVSAPEDLTIYLELYNLASHRNECCLEYEYTDDNGPFDYLSDREHQIPFIPSLGFIWVF